MFHTAATMTQRGRNTPLNDEDSFARERKTSGGYTEEKREGQHEWFVSPSGGIPVVSSCCSQSRSSSPSLDSDFRSSVCLRLRQCIFVGFCFSSLGNPVVHSFIYSTEPHP